MHLGMRVLSIRGDQTSKTALFSSREAGNDLDRHVSMIVETDNLNRGEAQAVHPFYRVGVRTLFLPGAGSAGSHVFLAPRP